jgi:hypothetical protein
MPAKKPAAKRPPIKRSVGKWSAAKKAEKQRIFLETLATGRSVAAACGAAALGRATAYEWRHADPDFAIAWEEADQIGVEALEDEARRRAVEGVEEPVGFHQGAPSAYVRRFSDTLLMFLLKGKRPDIYRDNASVEVAGKNGGPIETKDVGTTELARRIAFLLTKGADAG